VSIHSLSFIQTCYTIIYKPIILHLSNMTFNAIAGLIQYNTIYSDSWVNPKEHCLPYQISLILMPKRLTCHHSLRFLMTEMNTICCKIQRLNYWTKYKDLKALSLTLLVVALILVIVTIYTTSDVLKSCFNIIIMIVMVFKKNVKRLFVISKKEIK
jgi:hypothetical protein